MQPSGRKTYQTGFVIFSSTQVMFCNQEFCFIANSKLYGISKPSNHVRLNSEIRADLATWHCFLSSYNGVTLLIGSKWISSESTKLYTDAASTEGFAAVFGS